MTFTSAKASWKTSWSTLASSVRRIRQQRLWEESNARCRLDGRFRWNRRSRSNAKISNCSFRAKTQRKAWQPTWKSGRRSLKRNKLITTKDTKAHEGDHDLHSTLAGLTSDAGR